MNEMAFELRYFIAPFVECSKEASVARLADRLARQ